MHLLGRYGSVPLVAVLAVAGLYRGWAPAADTPRPSPMVVELPGDRPRDAFREPGGPQDEGQQRLKAGLLRMMESGISEEIVASHAKSNRYRPTADDLIDLKGQGASEWLLGRLADGESAPAASPVPPSAAPPAAPLASPPAAAPAPEALPSPPPPGFIPIILPPPRVVWVPEGVVEAPPAPAPDVSNAPVLVGEFFGYRPFRHGFGGSTVARVARIHDPAFRPIPFLPNPPMPAPSIVTRGAGSGERARGR